MTVFVLSRLALMITITAGVVQAKILCFTKAFLLSSRPDRVCPTCSLKKIKKKREKREKDEIGCKLKEVDIIFQYMQYL